MICNIIICNILYNITQYHHNGPCLKFPVRHAGQGSAPWQSRCEVCWISFFVSRIRDHVSGNVRYIYICSESWYGTSAQLAGLVDVTMCVILYN